MAWVERFMPAEDCKLVLEGQFAENEKSFSVVLSCHEDLMDEPVEVPYFLELEFDTGKMTTKRLVDGEWLDKVESAGPAVKAGDNFEMTFLPGENEISFFYYDKLYNKCGCDNQDIYSAQSIQVWDGLKKMRSMKIVYP